MEQYIGKSIFKGIAIGKIYFYSKGEQQVKRNKVEDIDSELSKFNDAKEQAIVELNQ